MVARPYQQGDEAGVYAVCVETAEHGEPSRLPARSQILLPLVFAGPYLELQPEFAFVLVDNKGIAGYVLGALDSAEFYHRWETEWTPRWVTQFPDIELSDDESERDPADWLRYLLHHPARPLPPELESAYPSHLHIDLLPRARRQGHGRHLLTMLADALRLAGSPGVHLGVAKANENARAFYTANGFEQLAEDGGSITMGLKLS